MYRHVAQCDHVWTYTGKKIVFRTLGFILSTLGSVPSNVFTVVLGTLNTFGGTDPKVDRLKPKVRNTIFFPVVVIILFTAIIAYVIDGLGTRLMSCIIKWV